MKLLTRYCQITVLLLCLFGTNLHANEKPGYRIEFELSKTTSDTSYLAHFYGSKLVFVDTALFFKNKKIVFEGAQKLKSGLYMMLNGEQKLEFIVSEQHFSIKGAFENPTSIVVEGSSENSIYYHYKSFIAQSLESKDSLSKTYHNAKDDPNFKKEMKILSSKVVDYKKNVFSQHAKSWACKLIAVNDFLTKKQNVASNTAKREQIFEAIDLKDSRMLFTPYIEEGIIKYLNLTPFNPDSLVKNCDRLFTLSRLNLEVNQFVISYLIQKFESENKPWFDVLYIHLNTKYVLKTLDPKSDTSSIIQSKIKRREALLTGSVAPEINFFDTTGQRVTLHSVKARYTLVYFWDPDCEHCQITTPLLNDLYKQYDSNDFQVYAVSTQQIYKKWAKYIAVNKLNWINVWEPELIESIYRRYQIGSTPQLFLLDAEKRFICKNISMNELEAYLHLLNIPKK